MHRFLLFALALLPLCQTILAQDNAGMPSSNVPAAQYQSEIGIFTADGGSEHHVSTQGVQYTRWKNEQKAHRLFLAYGRGFEKESRSFHMPTYDTLLEKSYGYRSDMLVIGGAVMEQRHLFRKI